MSGKSTGISVAEMPPATISDLQELKAEHEFDLNLPSEIEKELDDALATGDVEIKGHVVEDLLEDSPYPEVRAAVLNYDEGGTGNTVRAWVLGLVFATLGSGLNALFSLHSPTISITSYIAEVVAFPFGVAWARFLPNFTCTIFGNKLELNPGPFTKKEHALITIMANATFAGGFAYTLDIITAQRGFYGQRYGWPFEIFTTISTQTLGFGLGGVLHRFLVEPAAMIWPSNLVNTTLFTAMHERGLNPPDPAKTAGWTISRYRMFMYIMIGAFCWYWFPGLIAPFLSVFAFVTWIKPNNVIINQLFGGATGISLIPISFDWSIISGYVLSPMISPWFAIANTLIGMVAWFWILTPALHYSNVFYGKFLPMSDSDSYDNTGGVYNVTKILTPEYTFDQTKYESYSPLFLSTTFALCYGLSFAGLAAVIVHVALFHGKEIWHRMRAVGQKHEDIHSRLMAKYETVPIWWYLIVLVIMTAIGLAVVLSYPTHMSWWAFFVSLIIALVWTLPIGMIQATTNIQLGLNVITEFIVGYIQPGKPMAMMLFKTYGYISMSQALYFCQDMKLGKTPAMFPTSLGLYVDSFWTMSRL
jgi:OPT family small oligopeptide transporter